MHTLHNVRIMHVYIYMYQFTHCAGRRVLVMCVRVHDQRYKEGEGKVDICSGRG